ncbi:MAG: thioesterase family protein, partial [Planctomycetota bacterium]
MPADIHRIRVRYAETDQMAVAHHSAYVAWFEEARIAWLRNHGHSYKQLEESGTIMPVVELTIRYRKAARFDDELALTTTAVAAGPSRVVFTTVITRGDDT